MTSTTTTADVTTEALTVRWGGPLQDYIDVGDTVGTIQLERKLGKGGHARVYQGTCSATGARRAVKVLYRREFLNRFTWEYKLLDRVQSPHLVRVHSFHLQPAPHYVMDFLPGTTLERYRRLQGGMLPINEVLRIAYQVCDGLEHLHSIGIIHRDLTPKNVIRGPEGHITLIDLGIAKTLPEFIPDNDHIVTTSALGTPGFVAPEQEALRTLDNKVDFYGLGALLYYLLTGHKYRPSVGVDLDDEQLRIFLQQLVALDPKQRFTSLDWIRSELDALVENYREDIPATTVYVVQRSNRVPMLVAVLLVFVAVGLLLRIDRSTESTAPTTTAAISQPAPKVSPPAELNSAPVINPVPEPTPSPNANGSAVNVLPPTTNDENKAVPAPTTFAEPAPATPTESAPEQTKPAANKRTRRRKKSAKTPEQKQFETKLRQALATCTVSPQKITYRVTPSKFTVKGRDLGFRHTCVEKFVPRTDAEFSGTIHHKE